MSVKKVHGEQPKEFKFSAENMKKVEVAGVPAFPGRSSRARRFEAIHAG